MNHSGNLEGSLSFAEMQNMSNEEFGEREIQFMRMLSFKFAKAKADRTKLEHARKALKASIALEKKANLAKMSVQQQILEAEADPRYHQLLEALHTATELEARYYWELELGKIKFEKWRTVRADSRAAANLR